MKKPDNYAENKALLPYSDNVSGPVIKPDNVALWKNEKIDKTNKYFLARFEDINKEYLRMMEEFKWNDLVYKADTRFTPSKGHEYHLYQRKNESLFLSIIAPNEWDQIYIGSFRLDSDDKWEKIDWHNS